MRVRKQQSWAGVVWFIIIGLLGGLYLFVALVFEITKIPAFLAFIGSAIGVVAFATPKKQNLLVDDRPEREEKAFQAALKAFDKHAPSIPKGEGMFSIPVAEVMDVPRVLNAVLKPIYDGPPSDLRKQLDVNRKLLSGRDGKEVWPEKFQGTGTEAIEAYLADTPLQKLFDGRKPINFDDETRFRHTFVVAPTGTGKTNLLQHFLKRDFDRVARGECSVIVMDATGDLYNDVTRLHRFAGINTPLVLADVSDGEYPLSISMFDFGLEKVSAKNRARVRATARDLINYLFGALLNVKTTGLQAPSLRYALEVLIECPDANLPDLMDFLKPGGWRKYEDLIDRLRPDLKRYFEENDRNVETAKRNAEVVRRIEVLMSNAELSNMFRSRKSRLEFFEKMNEPCVVFINLERAVLREDLELYGRYFLARVLAAAERRIDVPERKRLPCFLYIDECQHILKNDERISDFMDGVRKYRVGGTFLTQGVGEFEHRPLDAILRNVGTIFATDLRDGAPERFARFMNTTGQFIAQQPQYHFAMVSKPAFPKAVSVPIPLATLFSEPKMSEAEHQKLIAITRQRYATPVAELYERPGRPEPPDELPPPSDPKPVREPDPKEAPVREPDPPAPPEKTAEPTAAVPKTRKPRKKLGR